MLNDDYGQFKAVWNGFRSTYDKPPLPDETVVIEFRALVEYSISDITAALMAHKSDPKESRYCPNAGHIVARLTGADLPAYEHPAAYEVVGMLPAPPDEARKMRLEEERVMARMKVMGLNLRKMPDLPGAVSGNGNGRRQISEEERRRVESTAMWEKSAPKGMKPSDNPPSREEAAAHLEGNPK